MTQISETKAYGKYFVVQLLLSIPSQFDFLYIADLGLRGMAIRADLITVVS